jgi:hypothetical protein
MHTDSSIDNTTEYMHISCWSIGCRILYAPLLVYCLSCLGAPHCRHVTVLSSPDPQTFENVSQPRSCQTDRFPACSIRSSCSANFARSKTAHHVFSKLCWYFKNNPGRGGRLPRRSCSFSQMLSEKQVRTDSGADAFGEGQCPFPSGSQQGTVGNVGDQVLC